MKRESSDIASWWGERERWWSFMEGREKGQLIMGDIGGVRR